MYKINDFIQISICWMSTNYRKNAKFNTIVLKFVLKIPLLPRM